MTWKQKPALDAHEFHVAELDEHVQLLVIKYPGEQYQGHLQLGDNMRPIAVEFPTAELAKSFMYSWALEWLQELDKCVRAATRRSDREPQ